MKTTFIQSIGLCLLVLLLLGQTTATANTTAQAGNNFAESFQQQTTAPIQKIYPTSSSTAINIVIGTVPEGASLQVFNLIGRKVADYPIRSNQTLEINVSNLPKGIYFTKIGNFQQAERFIVNH